MKSKQNAFERVCSITMCVIAGVGTGGGRQGDAPSYKYTHTQPYTRSP